MAIIDITNIAYMIHIFCAALLLSRCMSTSWMPCMEQKETLISNMRTKNQLDTTTNMYMPNATNTNDV